MDNDYLAHHISVDEAEIGIASGEGKGVGTDLARIQLLTKDLKLACPIGDTRGKMTSFILIDPVDSVAHLDDNSVRIKLKGVFGNRHIIFRDL